MELLHKVLRELHVKDYILVISNNDYSTLTGQGFYKYINILWLIFYITALYFALRAFYNFGTYEHLVQIISLTH